MDEELCLRKAGVVVRDIGARGERCCVAGSRNRRPLGNVHTGRVHTEAAARLLNNFFEDAIVRRYTL